MSDALALLRRTLDPRWLTAEPDEPLRVRARLHRPDGTPWELTIRIEDPGGIQDPRVWEDGTRVLPDCPARHFYEDGSFCLGFGPSGPPRVTNIASARRWWAVLLGYLELQLITELTGEWPPRYARPHGPQAALLDELWAWLEPLLPLGFRDMLTTTGHRPALRPDRVTLRRRPCPCGSGHAVKRCCEPFLSAILRKQSDIASLERPFWERHAGRACCGSVRNCPLASPSTPRIDHVR